MKIRKVDVPRTSATEAEMFATPSGRPRSAEITSGAMRTNGTSSRARKNHTAFVPKPDRLTRSPPTSLSVDARSTAKSGFPRCSCSCAGSARSHRYHQCAMTVDVWIPAGTRPEHRSLLPPISAIHDLPADGRLPARLGRGQFLVAGFSVERITQVIQRLDGLQVVQTLSAGVDRLADKIPAGVVLCDASGVHDTSVSEWVLMAILASLHNLPAHVDGQRNARWLEPATEADDLEDATVLIVGYGSIGRAVEARLAPFGVKFLRVAMHPRDGVSPPTELPDLLPRADVVIVLLPLTESTRGIVDAEFISKMRRGALLVNAARGPLVDTDALLASLLAGQIRAALDRSEEHTSEL